MTVRINYAMGRGDKASVTGLFNAGIVLGAISGLLAALVATVLALDSTTLGYLVYPVSPDGVSEGCSLIGSAPEVADGLRPFFLLMAWQWPFSFVNRTLSGVFLGAGCLGFFGLLGALRSAAPLIIWFGGLAIDFPDRVTLLGLAYWTGPPITTAMMSLFLACSPEMREQYGLHLDTERCRRSFGWGSGDSDGGGGDGGGRGGKGQGNKGGSNGGSGDGKSIVSREFLCSSLQAMATDLCAQASVTAGVYTAARAGLSTAYQVAAMQSMMPAFGQAWTLGISLAAKVSGPQFIAHGMPQAFVAMSALLCLYTFLLGIVVAVWGILPYTNFIGFMAGESACPYAASEGCAPLYADIFEGGRSLSAAFSSFAVVVAFNCPFVICKALLQACLDFRFQALLASLALAVGVAPSLLIAQYAGGGSAAAIYLAMYAPHALMALAFGARLAYCCRALQRGEHGPWTQVRSLSAISARMEDHDGTTPPLVGCRTPVADANTSPREGVERRFL